MWAWDLTPALSLKGEGELGVWDLTPALCLKGEGELTDHDVLVDSFDPIDTVQIQS